MYILAIDNVENEDISILHKFHFWGNLNNLKIFIEYTGLLKISQW